MNNPARNPGYWPPVRYLLVLWLLVLSAVAYLDRTNISIAGVEIAIWDGSSAHFSSVMPLSKSPAESLHGALARAACSRSASSGGEFLQP
jgi:hypothetical protein